MFNIILIVSFYKIIHSRKYLFTIIYFFPLLFGINFKVSESNGNHFKKPNFSKFDLSINLKNSGNHNFKLSLKFVESGRYKIKFNKIFSIEQIRTNNNYSLIDKHLIINSKKDDILEIKYKFRNSFLEQFFVESIYDHSIALSVAEITPSFEFKFLM